MSAATPGRFAGEVVLVTGAARGMGAAQARRAAEEGAFVVLADRLVEEGEALAADLPGSGMFVELDVAEEYSWGPAIERAQAAAGAPVTVLLHNAGVAGQGEIERTALTDFAQVIDVNLLGTFLAIRSVIASMKAAGHGAIVVNASVHAFAAHAEFASYCASKAGMLALVRVAALELAPHGVRVNAVAPGVIDTPRIRPAGVPKASLDPMARQVPLRRVGDAEDVAGTVLYLASNDAAYVSGTTVTVDGGMMAQVPLVISGAAEMDLDAGAS
jgi:3alpha(or 20beta)-hydroxysteroid dehydrogenase